MPTITIPFTDNQSYDSLPQSGGNRGTARRVSYNIKNRVHRHVLPLSIGGIVCFLLLVFTSFGHSAASALGSEFDNAARLRKYSKAMSLFERNAAGDIVYASSLPEEIHQTEDDVPIRILNQEHGHGGKHQSPDINHDNGLSVLVADEDELIAEDDLFWETYTETVPMTDEEKAAEAEIALRKQNVIEHDKRHSLRALVWWLVEGGLIPQDWDVPSRAYLNKMGGRGMERVLEAIGSGAEFEEGWIDYAKKLYRVAIFSKVGLKFPSIFRVSIIVVRMVNLVIWGRLTW